MSEIPVTFSCGDISLEGIWHRREGEGPFAAVVVCHPHPLYGGDMFNNVVLALCNSLTQDNILAFRFNFRGVGRSQGNFDKGIGEQEDVKAALSFVSSQPEVDPGKIGLAGYSFGATVALLVALAQDTVRALALISPPLASSQWEALSRYQNPTLLLCGSGDQFVSAADMARYASQLPPPSRWEVISGADHFWWGYEPELARRVSLFFAAALKSVKAEP
jgi:hypothetical protein